MSDRVWTEASLQTMLDVEAALARAEAAAGVIPSSAATAIESAAQLEPYDVNAIATEALAAGNLAIPLIRRLTRRVSERDPAAAGYVHWGATSQDIIDTSLVLQLRASVPPIADDVGRAANAAAAHARRYLDTPIAGRTWLQHATPTTFGLKCAGWLDALTRARRGLRAALDEAMVLQFGGASGTLASLGDKGLEVSSALARELSLREPTLPWHTHRERIAALACALGIVCGTLGKIGRDLALLAQTEVGEAHEPAEAAGGSSAMPQKRNPVRAAIAVSAAIRAPGLVATILAAMIQEHERAFGGWPAEWDTLPQLVTMAAGSARATADALDQLVVDSGRMRANLDASHGLIMAEAVSMRLAERLGKREAHQLVEGASRRAIDEQRDFVDVLGSDPVVSTIVDRTELARLMTPESYLGSARAFVHRALQAYDAGTKLDA